MMERLQLWLHGMEHLKMLRSHRNVKLGSDIFLSSKTPYVLLRI